MSLQVPPKFQHILRIANTNVEGDRKIAYALTAVKGIGRRFAELLCKKAEINLNKRAGECTEEEMERINNIMKKPQEFKIPAWFLNRQRDAVDGSSYQTMANTLDTKLREDLERLKKMRCHRGLRHHWGLRVRGQHTKTTGRKGSTMGVSKKKGQ